MRLLMLSLFAFTIVQCKKKIQVQAPSVVQQIDPSFNDFYFKFHADSIFQFEHIHFPLEGLPDFADSTYFTGKKYYYTPAKWRMHKPYLIEKGWNRNVSTQLEGVVVEKLIDPVNRVAIERRFIRRNNDWFLFYYAGLNRYVE